MTYHDWHLAGYAVSDGGSSIRLHLRWPYAASERADTCIDFDGVALYRFIHTQGAILTDIEERDIGAILDEHEDDLSACARQQGVAGWRTSFAAYKDHLRGAGLKGWTVDSAIGFSGFVIARRMHQPASGG